MATIFDCENRHAIDHLSVVGIRFSDIMPNVHHIETDRSIGIMVQNRAGFSRVDLAPGFGTRIYPISEQLRKPSFGLTMKSISLGHAALTKFTSYQPALNTVVWHCQEVLDGHRSSANAHSVSPQMQRLYHGLFCSNRSLVWHQ